jgi:hypothetical protein
MAADGVTAVRPCLGIDLYSRSSADPVDLGPRIDLIGALEPMSIEAVLAAPNGGSSRASQERDRSQKVTLD